jgi:hypothetical protein
MPFAPGNHAACGLEMPTLAHPLARRDAFRYSGGVARLPAMGFRLAVLAAVASCAGGPRSPEEARERLAQAVEARDGARLFDALDLETRWSWMSIQRAQRETYDIILSNFPEGSERQRYLRRCEAGALSENARALFASQLEPAAWEGLAAGLAGVGPLQPVADDRAEGGSAGHKLVFRRAVRRGGWGFAGLAGQAEDIKRRSLADLEVVRTSAADLERAATRSRP